MTRNHVQTVTPLPILVEVKDLKDADGRATFLDRDDSEIVAIRAVRDADIKSRLSSIFQPKELPLFLGAIALKQALNVGDEYSLSVASDKIRPWMRDFAELPNLVLEMNVEKKCVSLKHRGIDWRYSAFRNYSRLMAQMFEKARPVLWFSETEGRFLPAIYCPDWKTAAFVDTFIGGRLRVCPYKKCNRVFIPAADNVNYCSPAHRDAHRVQRSRWRKRAESRP